MLGRGLGKALFRRSPDEVHGQGLRKLLGEQSTESLRVEEVVAQTALAVLGESFGLTCIVVARAVDHHQSADSPGSTVAQPSAPEVWSWALPSWAEHGAAAFEVHGLLWHLLNNGGGAGRVEQLQGGWAWLGGLDNAAVDSAPLGAVAYRHRPFSAQESEALRQSLGAVASVLGPGRNREAAEGRAFNGSGRLTISDATTMTSGPEPEVGSVTSFVATLRVGRTLTSTGRGDSHVIAVARAAASSLQPQPAVRFADEVNVGERTITVVLLETVDVSTSFREYPVAGHEPVTDTAPVDTASGNPEPVDPAPVDTAPVLRLGLSIRPAGDINGGAAAVFEAMGWPDNLGRGS